MCFDVLPPRPRRVADLCRAVPSIVSSICDDARRCDFRGGVTATLGFGVKRPYVGNRQQSLVCPVI